MNKRMRQVYITIHNILTNMFINMIITKSKFNDIQCKLPKSTTLAHHGIGIIINKNVKFGKNCTIYQNVTIGHGKNGFPTIGNNVVIYANSVIIGKISIGNNVIIGACSFVNKNVPDNAVVIKYNKILR